MGRSDSVHLAAQDDLITAATTAVFSPPVTEEDISIDREELDIDETLGTRAPGPREYGGRVFSGGINGAARPTSIGLILTSFFGPPVSTQPASVASPTVWRHVWDPVATVPAPISIWTVNNDATLPAPIVDKFVGALGNELALNCEANNYLLFEAGYLARLLDISASAPATGRDTTRKWPFHQVTAQISVPSVSAGAYQNVPLRDFGLSYNNNVEGDQFVLGSVNVDSLPIGDIDCEVTITPTVDIAAHYRRALADTPELVKVKISAVGGTIEDAFKFQFDLEVHALETAEAPVDIDGGETLRDVEVTLRSVLDDSTNKLITPTLTNSHDGTGYVAA